MRLCDDEKCWRERLREDGPVERSVVAINFLLIDAESFCCYRESFCPTAAELKSVVSTVLEVGNAYVMGFI